MRILPVTALTLATMMTVAPVWAQTTTAPATAVTAPEIVVKVPDGYVFTELSSATTDQLKGIKIYDAADNKVGEIADLEIGGDGKVTKVITDVGGFLGMGEHQVGLSPDQIAIYKNDKDDYRAYVGMTKDEMKALPKYVAPN